MADMITFTSIPVQVNDSQVGSAGLFQVLTQTVDISAYDQLDLVLTVQNLTVATGVTVEVWTGMQNQTDDGWVQLYTFGSQTPSSTPLKAVASPWYGLLRYARWKVTALAGAGTRSATFTLSGMARKGF